MELRSYIEKFGHDAAERLARGAGTNYAYLSQIAYGHRQASPKLAIKIEGVSEGIVSRVDLRPDIFGPAPQPQEQEAA